MRRTTIIAKSRSALGNASRRAVFKYGLAAGGALLLQNTLNIGRASSANDSVASPPTTPFVEPLPIASIATPILPTIVVPNPGRMLPDDVTIYEVDSREGRHSFHPQLPLNSIWGYNGTTPGPTFIAEADSNVLVRFNNWLPQNDPVGIGMPINAIHRHGGFQASSDDGYPLDTFHTGGSRDYLFFNPAADSNLWYHDHSIDITAENVYRGLAGLYLIFDQLDSLLGETDPNPSALRLPGRMVNGNRQYDIPIVVQDRQFNANGFLTYDTFSHNGFIGDKFVVNGKIQPYFDVKPRKYRFRFLNGSNARQYEFVLREGDTDRPFDWVIGTDNRLFETPLADVESFRIASSERVQAVIDFSKYAGKEIYLVNRLAQTEGRKPDGIVSPGTQILKFRVSANKVADPSRVPATLRPIPASERPDLVLQGGVQTKRVFKLDRQGGAWAINGELFDENRISASPKEDEFEIWELNSSGGWEHPVHIHLTNFFIISRDGKTPAPIERGWKDVVVVGGDRKSVKILIKFSGFTGKYALHCHNMEHEDARMMANFEVMPKRLGN